jgi:hypothetical protein
MPVKNPELPRIVQTKLMRLEVQEQQTQMLINSTLRTIGDLERAISNNPSGERAASMKREIDFQQNSLTVLQTKHRDLAALTNNIRRYLELLPADVDVTDAKPVKCELRKG